MKLKLHRARWESNGTPNGKCYPNVYDDATMNLWWHLFPANYASEYQYTEQYISQVEFLAKAHGWEIAWLKY